MAALALELLHLIDPMQVVVAVDAAELAAVGVVDLPLRCTWARLFHRLRKTGVGGFSKGAAQSG